MKKKQIIKKKSTMIYKCMNRGVVSSDLTMPSRFCLQDWWSIPRCGPD